MPQLLGNVSAAQASKGSAAKTGAGDSGSSALPAQTRADEMPVLPEVGTAEVAKRQEESEPSSLMLLLLCAVSMLEGIDTQLLPSSMYALQRDIGFELTDLAYLTVAQGVCINVVQDLCKFLSIPTFCVMIMQGIFGTIPWTVMGNMMLYFQLSGIDDGKASALTSEQPIAGAVGNLLGGIIADALALKCGYHGRPLSAQITVALGIPLIWLIFGGVPVGSAGFCVYFALIAAFGLLGSWAQSGTNFPILSEIVPASSRSRVMAWECALENSIANLLGPPVVTLLATKAFGYTFSDKDADGKDLASAAALGKAMQATICIPWVITLGAYTLLHWSYPRDVQRLELQTEAVEQQQRPDIEGVGKL